MEQKITPKFIEKLNENEIFVFTSNELGKHFDDSGKIAVKYFGAILFMPEGLQGKSYAIPIMDKKMKPLSTVKIKKYVNTFIEFAKSHPNITFYLTNIASGIDKVSNQAIKDILKDCIGIENIAVPIELI
jgi:predicted nucleotide-binding protein (sugar kinase/HSP70/actin superfamily)